MRLHEIQSIEILAGYDNTFAFIADPENLPRWAEAFAAVQENRARLRTPRGETEIALEVEHDVRSGIVDWRMTFADGSVAFANSRLTRGSDGRLVYAIAAGRDRGSIARAVAYARSRAGASESARGA